MNEKELSDTAGGADYVCTCIRSGYGGNTDFGEPDTPAPTIPWDDLEKLKNLL